MTQTNYITIKDYNTIPIWGGEEIYFMAKSPLSISGQTNLSIVNKNFLDIDVSNDLGNWVSNYSRRKSNSSYGGIINPNIKLVAVFNPLTVGTTTIINSSTVKIFTPSKLFELILQPRTIYIKDEFLIRTLLSAEEGSSPAIYSSQGMPVVLQGYALNPTVDGKEVIMNLSFIEVPEAI